MGQFGSWFVTSSHNPYCTNVIRVDWCNVMFGPKNAALNMTLHWETWMCRRECESQKSAHFSLKTGKVLSYFNIILDQIQQKKSVLIQAISGHLSSLKMMIVSSVGPTLTIHGPQLTHTHMSRFVALIWGKVLSFLKSAPRRRTRKALQYRLKYSLCLWVFTML